MYRLEFENPIFHSGENLTVRRGVKWYLRVKVGDFLFVMGKESNTGFLAVVRDRFRLKFSELEDADLSDEHDPACTTVQGLFETMKRIYSDFGEHELITLLRFVEIDSDMLTRMWRGRG